MHVFDKYSGERLGEVREASAADVHRAVTRASATAPAWGAVAAHKRSTILRRTAELLESKREALAELIAREAGKAWKHSDDEVARSVETFTFAGEEAKRIHGETVPMDASAFGENRIGLLPARAARRGVGDHAVQLPAQPGRAQGGAGACRRQHRRAQAGRGDAAHRRR